MSAGHECSQQPHPWEWPPIKAKEAVEAHLEQFCSLWSGPSRTHASRANLLPIISPILWICWAPTLKDCFRP